VATYLRNGVWETRASIWLDVCEKAPHNWRAQGNAALALIDERQFDEAREHAAATLRLSPRDRAGLYAMALVHLNEGRLAEAREFAVRSSESDPKYAAAHNGLGLIAEKEGRVEEARKHFLDALERDAASTVALLNLARLLGEREPQSALDYVREAVERDPGNARTRNALGCLLRKQGKPKEAAQEFLEAARCDPKLPEARFNMAALLETVRPELAVREYRKALELRGDWPEAHNNLGAVLMGQGEWEQAREHLEEALRLHPDLGLARLNLADLLERQGRRDDARRRLEECLRLDPELRKTAESRTSLKPLLDNPRQVNGP
jgi:tetratricopeptide (TPR) repeat protein